MYVRKVQPIIMLASGTPILAYCYIWQAAPYPVGQSTSPVAFGRLLDATNRLTLWSENPPMVQQYRCDVRYTRSGSAAEGS